MITDAKLKSAKGRDKPYKLHDDKGLFLIVRPNGNKWWRFKYRFEDRAKEISLGVYPEVKLKQARDLRNEYREDVADKIEPSAKRQAEDK